MLSGPISPEDDLAKGFRAVSGKKHVKGFAVGRTIFNEAAVGWLGGKISDDEAVGMMAARFGNLVDIWNKTNG